MRGYYYLMTSLPSLNMSADAKVPFTAEKFLETVKPFVPHRDYEVVESIIYGRSIDRAFISEYDNLKKQIDAELAERRALHLGYGLEQYRNRLQKDSAVKDLVDKAVLEKDPLKAEIMVNSLYWKCLDKILGLHKFDLTELAVYAVKLKLLMRKEKFEEKKGSQEFERIFSSLHVTLED